MRLGLNLGQWTTGMADAVARARAAERLGYDSVWVAEIYGTDAVTPLTWIGAHTEKIKLGTGILQMTARVPAMTAMTAMTLDLMSNGRVLLGLGVSGPQVVEGWHGVAYGSALKRTREYVQIVRTILKRDAPLEHHGEHYDIPLRGGTGLGKPLKLIQHPLRTDIPIYLAAIGPKNVALSAEIADGWLPVFYSPERRAIMRPWLDEGFARREKLGLPRPNNFDIAPSVSVILGGDIAKCRAQLKPGLALYIGGMGARGKNFYNDLVCRYGFEAEAKAIQDLYLGGRKEEAASLVPDELVDEVALCGPRERIAERFGAWRDSGVTTLRISSSNVEALRMMAELVL